MVSKPWCKLWERWYTTRSHVGLGGVALNIGPRLISLANGSPKPGWLVTSSLATGDGGDVVGDVTDVTPISVETIAREVRFALPDVATALRELLQCGTLSVDSGGVLFFPNFAEWQTHPGHERTRRWREKRRSRDAGDVDTVTNVLQRGSEDRRSEDQRSEEERSDPSDPETDICRLAAPGAPAKGAAVGHLVDAWNAGAAGTKIAKAKPPSAQTLDRDKALREAAKKYPGVVEWEWCARALATSPHHRGENGWGPASLPWLLQRRNAPKLEEWMSNGEGLREGTWKPPERVFVQKPTQAQRAAQMAIEERQRENARAAPLLFAGSDLSFPLDADD